jgi:EF-P beta-lysylation protein EpmB
MDDGSAPTIAAWQRAEYVTRPVELLRLLQLDPATPGLDAERLRDFPLRVPRGFVTRMRPGDPWDPLFRQVWPATEEARELPGYGTDAVGDLAALESGGLIRKYRGRVLLIASGACAVHCRYCFRRHFPYADAAAARDRWREALRAIAADPSIREVILSGGDPLALNDDKLAALAEGLEGIAHVRRLRIHTRLPVMLPERVDGTLLRWLGNTRLAKSVVLHVNHPDEIDRSVAAAFAALTGTGAVLLNQAVLLKGVNDDAGTLASLSERLFESGVLPYYLHMLDRVQGVGHFGVNPSNAKTIMRELAAQLPGYLVPRLVREVAGAPAKTPLPW